MAEPVTTDPAVSTAARPRGVDVHEPFTELEGVRQPSDTGPPYGNGHSFASSPASGPYPSSW